MDREWRNIMKNANENPEVCALMKASAGIPDSLELCSQKDCL